MGQPAPVALICKAGRFTVSVQEKTADGAVPELSVRVTETGNVPVADGVPDRLVPAPVAERRESQDGPERLQL